MTKLLLMLFLASVIFAVPAAAETQPPLKTDSDRVNYAIGVNIAGNLKRQGVDLKPDMVIKGMRDVFAGKGLLLNDYELRDAMTRYFNEVRRKQSEKIKKSGPDVKR